MKQTGNKSLVMAGGVAANKKIKSCFRYVRREGKDLKFFILQLSIALITQQWWPAWLLSDLKQG